MEIERIISLISTTGFPIIVASLVVYYLHRIASIYMKSFEEKMIKKNTIERISSRDLVNKKKLLNLMHELEADRIILFYYHNGTRGLDGLGYYHVSPLYEEVSFGTKPALKLLGTMPIATTTFWNIAVVRRENIKCGNLEEIKDKDMAVYEHLKIMGVQAFHVSGWYDENGLPKGFAHISFCKKKKKITKKEEDLVDQVIHSL